MKCPGCDREEFANVHIGGVELDFCAYCLGLWFEEDELRRAKDTATDLYRWFDGDIWQEVGRFRAGESERICPLDGIAMHHLHYGNSPITIDACKQCGGIWLDRGEFQRIVAYTKHEGRREIWDNYYHVLKKEAGELFIGPEGLRSEAEDLLMVIKLFHYRFMARHPQLTQFLQGLQVSK